MSSLLYVRIFEPILCNIRLLPKSALSYCVRSGRLLFSDGLYFARDEIQKEKKHIQFQLRKEIASFACKMMADNGKMRKYMQINVPFVLYDDGQHCSWRFLSGYVSIRFSADNGKMSTRKNIFIHRFL